MSENPYNVDEEVTALSEARAAVAFQRALRDLGIGYTLGPDGVESIDTDWQETIETDQFYEAFAFRLKELVVDDAFESLRDKGLIEPNGADPETGEIIWRRTPLGEELARQAS